MESLNKNDQNPLLTTTVAIPPISAKKPANSDRLLDVKAQPRNFSLPDKKVGFRMPEGSVLSQEKLESSRVIEPSSAKLTFPSTRGLGALLSGQRVRGNTSPDNLWALKKKNEEFSPRSRALTSSQRSIHELQRSLLDPEFRRKASRLNSQAKISTFKQVKSQNVHPEVLIYKVKKVTMTRKFDPEIGKIKIRQENFGIQEFGNFPKKPDFSKRRIDTDYPSSVSSTKSFNKQFVKPELSVMAINSQNAEANSLRQPSKKTENSVSENLISPNQKPMDESQLKFDFVNENNRIPDSSQNQEIVKNESGVIQFGLNPIPVLPLRPKIVVQAPILSNRRTSFSQNRKFTAPVTPASVEKEENLTVRKSSRGPSIEERLSFLRTQLKSSQKINSFSNTLSENQSRQALLKDNLKTISGKNPSAFAETLPKGQIQQKSIIINEEQEISQIRNSSNDVSPKARVPEVMQDKAEPTKPVLLENQLDEHLLISNLDSDQNTKNQQNEMKEVSDMFKTQKADSADRNSFDPMTEHDIEEEQDIVPKIDLLKKLKMKNQEFSVIQETEEENRSISSKVGTDLHFGVAIGEKFRPSDHKRSNDFTPGTNRPSNHKNSEQDSHASNFDSLSKGIGESMKVYGTNARNATPDNGARTTSRNTINFPQRTNTFNTFRYNSIDGKQREGSQIRDNTIADPIQFETTSEKSKEDQSYLENFDKDEPGESVDVIKGETGKKVIPSIKETEDGDVVPKINQLGDLEVKERSAIGPSHDIDEIDKYLAGINNLNPTEEEPNPTNQPRMDLGKSADVSWEFSDNSKVDIAEKKSKTALINQVGGNLEVNFDASNRNFTFQGGMMPEKIDGTSMIRMTDSNSEQLLASLDNDDTSKSLFSKPSDKIIPEDTTLANEGIYLSPEEPQKIPSSEIDSSFQKKSAQFVTIYPQSIVFTKESEEVVRVAIQLPVCYPLSSTSIRAPSEKIFDFVNLPITSDREYRYVSQGSELIKPISKLPYIEPAEVSTIDLYFESLETQGSGLPAIPPLSVVYTGVISDSIRKVSDVPTIKPELVTYISKTNSPVREKVFNLSLGPKDLMLVSIKKQDLSAKVLLPVLHPTKREFIYLPKETLESSRQVEQTQKAEFKTVAHNDDLFVRKDHEGADMSQADAPNIFTQQLTNLPIYSSEKGVGLLNDGSMGRPFRKQSSEKGFVLPGTQNDSPAQDSFRKSRPPILKSALAQKKIDSNFNIPLPKGLKDRENSPKSAKSSLKSDNTISKNPKENTQSYIDRTLTDREASYKKVGWVFNKDKKADKSVTNTKKGVRVPIDYPDPNVSVVLTQNTPNKSNQSSKRILKKKELEDSSEGSKQYESFSDKFYKINKEENDEFDDFDSFADDSLADLKEEQIRFISERRASVMPQFLDKIKYRKRIRHAKLLSSVFCFFFVFSSVLWIILLKMLSDENAYLSTIILYTPKLSEFHQSYSDHFVSYHKALKLFAESENTLQHQKYPRYHEHADTMKEIADIKIDNSISMLTIKKHLIDLVKRIPSQKKILEAPRELNLGTENQKKVEKFSSKSNLQAPISEISKINTRLLEIRGKMEKFDNYHDQMASFLREVQGNVQQMYIQCFDLIKGYGQFYVMTNRIWVTTQSIYNFYKGKVEDVLNEMSRPHFVEHLVERKELKLLNLHYKTWTKLNEFPRLIIEHDRRSILMCMIKASVKNHDLSGIGRSFDFFLSLTGHTPENKQSFNYKILADQNSIVISQMLEVPSGLNKIALFGIISGSEVSFSHISVSCMNLIDFKFNHNA
jgi:hypothetical protein